MNDVSNLDSLVRPPHPLHQLWRVSRRWSSRLGTELGLLPKLADRGYIICASARSGSTYFCRLLSSTGRLGNPREYFNLEARRNRYPDYPAEPRKQLRQVLSRGATDNGIYGVKVFPWQLRRIGTRVDLFRDLPDPVVVRLVRKDVLGQAISQARARQTGQYGAGAPQVGPPAYDPLLIRRSITALARDQEFWRRIMECHGIEPLTVEYEAIAQDPQRAVDQVARRMGIQQAVPIDLDLVPSKVQRDGLNVEWRERFLSETGDEFRHLA